ncbi:YcaO-like family protein [Streptacidiphilus sp. 4-A2]|nr:YcaO-like family protein [Streptacidiphilus sp. 4-A2]
MAPFDPRKPIPWVQGVRLGSGEPVLVPRRMVYYGGDGTEDNFVYDSSNGCASGASLPEAILFGLLD